MTETIDSLLFDFVSWLAPAAKPYREVMEAWRTSCPRLTVWEDALDLGLVVRRVSAEGSPIVALTEPGQRWLEAQRAAARSDPCA